MYETYNAVVLFCLQVQAWEKWQYKLLFTFTAVDVKSFTAVRWSSISLTDKENEAQGWSLPEAEQVALKLGIDPNSPESQHCTEPLLLPAKEQGAE